MAQGDARPEFAYFSIDGFLSYVGFSEDCGPMSMGAVQRFCCIVDDQLALNNGKQVTMRALPDSKSLTNAIFLIGCYMIMKLGSSTAEVEALLKPLNPNMDLFESYVRNCWAGLHKANSLGWVDFECDNFDQSGAPSSCEQVDVCEMVPGKLLAIRPPPDESCDAADGAKRRQSIAVDYAEALRESKVEAVMSLDEPECSLPGLARHGVAVADLHFDEASACPPADVAMKFLMLAEGIPGAVAVQCTSGLGRAATLIGLYMMKHFDMAAGEAIGWARLVQPGSVAGEQEAFLRSKEPLMRWCGLQFRRHAKLAGPAAAAPWGMEAVQRFIDERVRTLDSRVHALLAADADEGAAGGGDAGRGGAAERCNLRRAARQAALILPHS